MASSVVQIPRKAHFKIGEVCRITDTQPYVLRFWESEFPSLAPQKTRSGQRLYRRKDIEMVLRIKHLLYEESYTIAGARKQLESADSGPEVHTRAVEPVAEEPGESDSKLERVKQELEDLLGFLDAGAGDGSS